MAAYGVIQLVCANLLYTWVPTPDSRQDAKNKTLAITMETRKNKEVDTLRGGRLQRGDKASRAPYKMGYYGDAMRIQ